MPLKMLEENDNPILIEIGGYNPGEMIYKLVFIYTRPSLKGKVDHKRDVICITPQKLYEILDSHIDRNNFKPMGLCD